VILRGTQHVYTWYCEEHNTCTCVTARNTTRVHVILRGTQHVHTWYCEEHNTCTRDTARNTTRMNHFNAAIKFNDSYVYSSILKTWMAIFCKTSVNFSYAAWRHICMTSLVYNTWVEYSNKVLVDIEVSSDIKNIDCTVGTVGQCAWRKGRKKGRKSVSQ